MPSRPASTARRTLASSTSRQHRLQHNASSFKIQHSSSPPKTQHKPTLTWCTDTHSHANDKSIPGSSTSQPTKPTQQKQHQQHAINSAPVVVLPGTIDVDDEDDQEEEKPNESRNPAGVGQPVNEEQQQQEEKKDHDAVADLRVTVSYLSDSAAAAQSSMLADNTNEEHGLQSASTVNSASGEKSNGDINEGSGPPSPSPRNGTIQTNQQQQDTKSMHKVTKRRRRSSLHSVSSARAPKPKTSLLSTIKFLFRGLTAKPVIYADNQSPRATAAGDSSGHGEDANGATSDVVREQSFSAGSLTHARSKSMLMASLSRRRSSIPRVHSRGLSARGSPVGGANGGAVDPPLTPSSRPILVPIKIHRVRRPSKEERKLVRKPSKDFTKDAEAQTALYGWRGLTRTIHPNARWLPWWNALILVIIVYNAVCITFRVAFDYTIFMWGSVMFLDFLGDLMLASDIGIRFRTGFEQNGIVCMQSNVIRSKYLRGWFVFDFIASIPVDLLMFHTGEPQVWLRLNKFVRLARVIDISMRLEAAEGVNVRLLKLVKLPVYVVFISHLIACGYFLVIRHENFEWEPELALDTLSLSSQYLSSLYWAMGMMSGRETGAVPRTDVESLYIFFTMMLGMIAFAYIVGSVGAIVESANEQFKQFQNKIQYAQRFLKGHQISPALFDRVVRYYDYLWSRNKGFNMTSVLADLPDVLKTEVTMHLVKRFVWRVELFRHLDPGFVPAIINKLRPKVFVPEEYVLKQGEAHFSMYFIQEGEVDVLSSTSADETNVSASLREGDHFGEYGLLLRRHCAESVRTVSFCDMFVLDSESFGEILQFFPVSVETLKRKASEKYERYLKKQRSSLGMLEGFDADAKPVPFEGKLTRKNALVFRKKIEVYAFQVDSPVVVNKSWGKSECNAGDWLICAKNGDCYTIGDELFRATYELMPQEEVIYRKTTTVMGAQIQRPCSVLDRKGEELIGKPGSFLLQDDKENKWFIDEDVFRQTYEAVGQGAMDGKDSEVKALAEKARRILNRIKRGHAPPDAQAHEIATIMWEDYGVIAPTSSFRSVWVALLCLIIVYNVAVIPFRLSFYFALDAAYILALDYIGDFLLMVDVLLNFRLTYMKNGSLVLDRTEVAAKYKDGRFWFDVLTSVPVLDLLMLIPSIGVNPFLRFPRMFKLETLVRLTSHRIKVSSYAAWLKLARLLTVFVFMSHWISCIFFAFTESEGFGCDAESMVPQPQCNEWLPGAHLEDGPRTLQYWRAQYFAFTSLTGMGKILRPSSNGEMVFTIITILIGVVVVAYLIGNMAALISNLDTFAVEYDKRTLAVTEFMKYHGLPLDMQARVKRVHAHSWSVQRGADPNVALRDLPTTLSMEIKLHMCAQQIRTAYIFRHTPNTTILKLIKSLSFEIVPPAEPIFLVGQLGQKMYFVTYGLVEIQLGQGMDAYTVKTVGPGSFFGEGALIRGGRRGASAIAVSSCSLTVLHRTDFARIMQDNEMFAGVFRDVSARRDVKVRRFSLRAAAKSSRSVVVAGKPGARRKRERDRTDGEGEDPKKRRSVFKNTFTAMTQILDDAKASVDGTVQASPASARLRSLPGMTDSDLVAENVYEKEVLDLGKDGMVIGEEDENDLKEGEDTLSSSGEGDSSRSDTYSSNEAQPD